MRLALLLSACVALVLTHLSVLAQVPLAEDFEREVDRQLVVPLEEQKLYATMMLQALDGRVALRGRSQFVLLVDRAPRVQAALLYWVPAGVEGSEPRLVGASPVSTGRPGSFEHFETPLGVFEHSLDNPDFRAEGTANELGLRGYGVKGRRVFDFGWQVAVRGWGAGGTSPMRLQLHATDPVMLEPRLGTAQSKGCIRTSGGFNRFLDLHAVLDADYDAALAQGQTFWMLSPQRQATAWSGRYLVIVETVRDERPAWSPAPPASK